MNKNPDNFHLREDAIEDRAAAWLAQREEGFTPEQEAEFLRWRLADPRHAEAVERLEQTCFLLERLPELRNDSRLHAGAVSTATPSRRLAPWFIAAGMAAAMAIAFWVSLPASTPTTVVYATPPGGYDRISLPDSSVAQLNAATELNVTFSSSERRVRLQEGEAHFHVAKDIARPFMVEIRDARVVAVGTAFNVRMIPDGFVVLVTEGVVRVERLSSDAPLVLAAGESATVGQTVGPVERVDATKLKSSLAWQAPRLVFVEAPLSEVVRRFNEHGRRVVLMDAELGRELVGGTFRQDDVETFVKLLEGSGTITVERAADGVFLLRRRR